MKTGLFLALEGIDGCGKSTQAARIATWLKTHSGCTVRQTREPGGCRQAEDIRKLILEGDADRWCGISETLLFFAARVEHLRNLILPALARGEIVLTDRYVGSSIAYQGIGRNVPLDFIEDLHAKACGGLMPDLTLIFDLPPEIGLARSLARLKGAASAESRMESEGIELQKRVRACFLDRARRLPGHVVIDASRDEDTVFADAIAVIQRLLDARKAA